MYKRQVPRSVLSIITFAPIRGPLSDFDLIVPESFPVVPAETDPVQNRSMGKAIFIMRLFISGHDKFFN